jgi:hypothetical protein
MNPLTDAHVGGFFYSLMIEVNGRLPSTSMILTALPWNSFFHGFAVDRRVGERCKSSYLRNWQTVEQSIKKP